jgi:hypothetical protein
MLYTQSDLCVVREWSRVMARMIRKQFYIEAEQDRLLKRLAGRLGVSEAELIRRGIDSLERDARAETAVRVSDLVASYRTGTEARGAAVPAPAVDLAAWEESKAFIEQRMRRFKDVPQTGRTWTRDELYDDDPRFSRWAERPAD